MDLFVRELFAKRIGVFFSLDVVVCAIALFVFICAERKTVAIRHTWLPIVATLVVGVSLWGSRYFFICDSASSMQPPSNQSLDPTAGIV
jgi:lysylphosphatidylglycerol synthetase-like protein (DUF2156 family)